jgi:hypothetical protein
VGGIVFVIGADLAEHWQRAQEAGFWESVRSQNVSRGDLLVFWQAGQRRLLGVTVATHATERADYSSQSRPWLSRDPVTYHFRYLMRLLPGSTDPELTWGGLMALVGQKPQRGANTAPVAFDESGARDLLQHFGIRPGIRDGLRADSAGSVGEQLLQDELSSVRPRAQSDQPYRPADEVSTSPVGVVFERDPEVVDRGLRGHARTQNLAAEWLRDHGIAVRSPRGGVNYDLAWADKDVQFVGEVKSLHDLNERHQLRLGIGQVLEYAHRLDARPVLIVERKPSEMYWQSVCEHLGIRLVWPEVFNRLTEPSS